MDIPYSTVFPSREEWESKSVNKQNELAIFTDGSKMEEDTGAGIHCETLAVNESFRLQDWCSVFQAEIFAIWQAARLVTRLDLTPTNVSIFVDSQAAIKALASCVTKSKLVKNTKKALTELQRHNVRLVWVPGHTGVEGNERADECARIGSAMPLEEATEDALRPLQDLYSDVDQKARRRADAKWYNTAGCHTSRALWPKLDTQRTKKLLQFSKTRTKTLIRVLTGHCIIGQMAIRYNLPHQDFCRSCKNVEEIETVQHLLCECPAFQRKRHQLLEGCFFDGLEPLAEQPLENIARFIESTGWFRH